MAGENENLEGVTPSDTSTEGDASSSDQWNDLSGEFLAGDAGVIEGEFEAVDNPTEVVADQGASPPAVAAPAPEVPPVPTQAAPTPAPATTPIPPAVPSLPTPAAEVPTAPQAPAAPVAPATPAPAFDYTKWRGEQVTALEAQYKLSDEDSAAMMTEPELVLPKLAANLHLRVMEGVLTSVQRMIPQILEQTRTQESLETKAKNLFAQANPDLTDPRFEQAIVHFGQTYRQLNAQAPAEEAVKSIGALVRAAYGLPPLGAQAAPAAASTPAPVAPTPFAPVRGSGGVSQPAGTPSNPFEALALEFLQDE